MVDLALKILLDDKARFPDHGIGASRSRWRLVYVQVGLFVGLLAQRVGPRLTGWTPISGSPPATRPNVDFGNPFPETYGLARPARSPAWSGADKPDRLVRLRRPAPAGRKESAVIYGLRDFTRWNLPWNVMEGNPADLRRGRYVFLDDSAHGADSGPFAVGEHREFLRTPAQGDRSHERGAFLHDQPDRVSRLPDREVALAPASSTAAPPTIVAKLAPGGRYGDRRGGDQEAGCPSTDVPQPAPSGQDFSPRLLGREHRPGADDVPDRLARLPGRRDRGGADALLRQPPSISPSSPRVKAIGGPRPATIYGVILEQASIARVPRPTCWAPGRPLALVPVLGRIDIAAGRQPPRHAALIFLGTLGLLPGPPRPGRSAGSPRSTRRSCSGGESIHSHRIPFPQEKVSLRLAVLVADDVRKVYYDTAEEVTVAQGGFSLALEAGEIVALEGPSGSGKTTLLSILGCLLTPTVWPVW